MGITVIAGLIFLEFICKGMELSGRFAMGTPLFDGVFPLFGIFAIAYILRVERPQPFFRALPGFARFPLAYWSCGCQARGFWTWTSYLQAIKPLMKFADNIKIYRMLRICDPPLDIADNYWNQIFLSTTRTGYRLNDFAGCMALINTTSRLKMYARRSH
jgi:hypothetical protein